MIIRTRPLASHRERVVRGKVGECGEGVLSRIEAVEKSVEVIDTLRARRMVGIRVRAGPHRDPPKDGGWQKWETKGREDEERTESARLEVKRR